MQNAGLSLSYQYLCALAEIPDDGLLPVKREGTAPLVVVKTQTSVSVLADACTHGDWPLSEGILLDDVLECPLHGGQFCVRTGRAVCPPAVEDVRVYESKVEDGKIWIKEALSVS